MAHCDVVKTPVGPIAVRSGRRPVRRCSALGCTRRSTRLCDYPTPTGSCDKPLCAAHARHVAHNVDHCSSHPVAQQALPWISRRSLSPEDGLRLECIESQLSEAFEDLARIEHQAAPDAELERICAPVRHDIARLARAIEFGRRGIFERPVENISDARLT
jgi:hypothetical protein